MYDENSEGHMPETAYVFVYEAKNPCKNKYNIRNTIQEGNADNAIVE